MGFPPCLSPTQTCPSRPQHSAKFPLYQLIYLLVDSKFERIHLGLRLRRSTLRCGEWNNSKSTRRQIGVVFNVVIWISVRALSVSAWQPLALNLSCRNHRSSVDLQDGRLSGFPRSLPLSRNYIG